MAVVNYLDKTDLPSAFNTANFDQASQNAVINQLIADGLYTPSNPDDGKSVWIESDIFQGTLQNPFFTGPTVSPAVQVLEVESSNVTVNTDAALKIIVDDGASANDTLTLTGGNHPLFVALGNSNTTVNLNDTGADTVLAGNGNDSITGNSGADQLFGGSGFDTLTAGMGHHQLLSAGSGPTQMTDMNSNGTDTLLAGSGPDTITGVQGDTFGLAAGTMAASGNDIYNIYNGHGNSTISLGTGSDQVNFFTSAGNDTISNGGQGTDTISFMNSGSGTNNFNADVKSITPGTGSESGDYLIKFTDGQSVDLIGHGVSASKVAFTIEFNDANVNLKGGS